MYNYADDNSMIYSSPDINANLTNLKHGCKNAIKWFGDKFQFIVLSSDPLEQQKIEIENDITLLSESRVKLLGVIIDDRLQFNDHISVSVVGPLDSWTLLPGYLNTLTRNHQST